MQSPSGARTQSVPRELVTPWESGESMEEFKRKYGVHGHGLFLMVHEFMVRAPRFEGNDGLEMEIREALDVLGKDLRKLDERAHSRPSSERTGCCLCSGR